MNHNEVAGRFVHISSEQQPETEQRMTSAARSSSAQPRPALKIPPRGIGPVLDPNENDVLCGRGGRINAHSGNVQFRALVQQRKKQYLAKETKKLQKAHIAADIVQSIRSMEPSGRFLKEDSGGAWFDIGGSLAVRLCGCWATCICDYSRLPAPLLPHGSGDAKAIKKVGQALREDAPDFREEDGEGDDNDDGRADSPPPAQKAARKTPILTGREVLLVPASVGAGTGSETLGLAPNGGGPYGFGGGVGLAQNPRFSGAAAAAVRESAEHDILYAQQRQAQAYAAQNEAFGRQFHPASVFATSNLQGSNHDGSSLISGLSNPTLLSGMSLSSAVSDPHLTNYVRHQQSAHLLHTTAPGAGYPLGQANVITSNSLNNPMLARANQLQHLRMHLAASQQAPIAAAPSDYSRLMLARAGLVGSGGSLLASSHLQQQNTVATGGPAPLPPMANTTANGGRIRSDSMSWTGNSSGHTLNEQMLAAAVAEGREEMDFDRDRPSRNQRGGDINTHSSGHSIGDDTYPSMAESIMSDLSENLIALDLAEPRMLDQV